MSQKLLRRSVVLLASALVPCAMGEVTIMVTGDVGGNVCVKRFDGAGLDRCTNVNGHAIGHVELIDVDGDGTLEIVVTHLDTPNTYTSALDILSCNLNTKWTTDHFTSYFTQGLPDDMGTRTWSGDFDEDGELELVIPYGYDGAPGGPTICVFSGTDGTLEYCLPQTNNYFPVAYQDAVDSAWRLVCQNAPNAFTHYLRAYNAADGSLRCENTEVNTWKRGAIGSCMIDGEPRVWGGWYCRTLYVVDRDCNSLWSHSYGGSLEAEGTYAGDLRGDGVEALIVGGTYGTNHVRVDAVRMEDGAVIWTYDDTNAHWAAHVLAVRDVDGDGIKEVFVQTSGNPASGISPRYVALDGSDGTLKWEIPYPNGTEMLYNAYFHDVDVDGGLEILLAVNNTIEAREAVSGDLVDTFVLDDTVTSFQVAAMTLDCNGNGVSDDEDILSGYSADCNHNGIPDECDLPGDINGDGRVSLEDLAELLGYYGRCVYGM